MAQAKKKKSTKTAKRTTTARTHKKTACRTCCKKGTISNRERMHVCCVAALSIIAGILLCADVALVTVR